MIEVVDTNGNARTIMGLQCICGTVYLTKKQYKKISNKAHLKIIEVNAPKMTATTSKQVMIKNNPDPHIDHYLQLWDRVIWKKIIKSRTFAFWCFLCKYTI